MPLSAGVPRSAEFNSRSWRTWLNAFWSDYAAHLADGGDRPFLSEHVVVPTTNFTEMMLALAVLDLPMEAAEHDSRDPNETGLRGPVCGFQRRALIIAQGEKAFDQRPYRMMDDR